MMEQIIQVVGGIMVAIISYFLKRTMDELKEVQNMAVENKTQIDILKIDYKNKIEHLTEKFDELKLAMTELIKEIKELNNRIK